MQILFLVALGVALLGVLFALQNIVPVQVSFLVWTFEGSLAVVLFVAVILGALVSVLMSVPSLVQNRWTIKHLTRQVATLEAELAAARAAARSPDFSDPKPSPDASRLEALDPPRA